MNQRKPQAPRRQSTSRLLCLLLSVVVAGVAAFAEQSEAEHKFFEDMKGKAEKGDAPSQRELGAVFLFGNLGVAKDPAAAVKWYRQAAEQNDAEAQVKLGGCYDKGEGVATNYAEAVKWYRKAAEQNDANGQFNLGVCYVQGRGVELNSLEAMKWYRKAAEQDHAEAQFLLGNCYAFGSSRFGVGKDEMEAVKWLRKAAEQNHTYGQWLLGVCYANGRGVAKDYVEAYKWWLLAAGQGDEAAKKDMPTLEVLMTQKQIAEGKRRASAFKPRKVFSMGER